MNLLEITEFSLWSQKWNLIWSGWIISPICLAIIYRRIDPKWMTESNSWNLPWLHFHISRAIKCLWCARALTQLAESSRQVKGSRGVIVWKYTKSDFQEKFNKILSHHLHQILQYEAVVQPAGPRAESARAVTGRRNSHRWEGGRLFDGSAGFFYGNSCNSGTKSRKIISKVGN